MEKSLQPILTEIESVFQTTILQVSAPMSGCNHTIYVLTLPHSIQWSLRIPKNESAASASASASFAARSIPMMRHIKQMDPTLHQIPNVIFSAEKYSVLEYLGGNAMGFGVWNLCSLPRSRRERILDGLAEVLYRLWRCLSASLLLSASSSLSMSMSMSTTTMTTTTTTYRSWLLHEVDLGIRRSIENPGWGDPLHFLLRRAKVDSLLPSIACSCGDESLGCLAIRHGDLNPMNVLVDDEGRLTGYVHIILYRYRKVLSISLSLSKNKKGEGGRTFLFFPFPPPLPFSFPFLACLSACLPVSINSLTPPKNEISRIIDWDTASFVPAPAAIHHPLFIANIPGFYTGVSEDMNFAPDRAYLEAAIRKLSSSSSPSSSERDSANHIADLLASSFERQFFEMALRNRRINDEYVRLRLLGGNPGEVDKKALRDELEEFLVRNGDLRGHVAIVELERRLC